MFRLFAALLSIGAWAGQESAPVRPDFDALPAGAKLRLGTLQLRHAAEVACVAWSPDQKHVASGGIDGTVAIWDAATGKPLRVLPGAAFFVASPVAFSPDGKLLATGHPRLRALLERPPSLEAKSRALKILEVLSAVIRDPGVLRNLREVLVLERIGTPEARRVLDEVAKGDPSSPVTRAAAAALSRGAARTNP